MKRGYCRNNSHESILFPKLKFHSLYYMLHSDLNKRAQHCAWVSSVQKNTQCFPCLNSIPSHQDTCSSASAADQEANSRTPWHPEYRKAIWAQGCSLTPAALLAHLIKAFWKGLPCLFAQHRLWKVLQAKWTIGLG